MAFYYGAESHNLTGNGWLAGRIPPLHSQNESKLSQTNRQENNEIFIWPCVVWGREINKKTQMCYGKMLKLVS